MSKFNDIVDATTKQDGTYVFQKLRLYDRGDEDIILIVEMTTAPKGIKFDMTVELTVAEAASLAGGLLSAVEKKRKKEAA